MFYYGLSLIGGLLVTCFVLSLYLSRSDPDLEDDTDYIHVREGMTDFLDRPLSVLLGTVANAIFLYNFLPSILDAFPADERCSKCFDRHDIPFALVIVVPCSLTILCHRLADRALKRLAN